MASINKLSIRGVRAFSPDDQEQVVEFYFPLTIITGANGCGKTTIIESLKFALSGSLPPGGGTRAPGQAFVHDPLSAGMNTVKANIKLRFTNKAGNSMVVIRSMEVTRRKTSMSFKQLDGVIRTIDAKTGERVTLSHKCGELDKQIPQLLGVSKAILDSVLFVHQEESSWPLQEAAVLKKRFDDIFDSTRYTKALDSFRKTKKELVSKVKEIKAEVAEFSAHKHAAKGFRKDLDAQKFKLEELETAIAENQENIRQAEKEKAKYMEIIDKLSDVRGQLERKTAQACNLKAMMQKQRGLLSEDLTQKLSRQELEDNLKDFDKQVKREKAKQEEYSREVQKLETEIEDLRRQETRLNNAKGKVEAEKEAQNKRLKDRMTMMEKIAQTYSLDLQQSMTQLSARLDGSFSLTQGSIATNEAAQELSKEDMRMFFKALKEKEEELKENLRQHKENFRKEENSINKALQDLYGHRNANEKEKNKLTEEGKRNDKEMKELTTKVGKRTIKKSMVEDAREAKNQAAKELADLTGSGRQDELQGQIKGLNNNIEIKKDEIQGLQRAKNVLKNTANLQTKIKMMQETRANDVNALRESINEKLNHLKSLGIEVPEDIPDDPTITSAVFKIADDVDKLYGKEKGQATEAARALDKERQNQTQRSYASKSLKQTLESLEKRRDVLKQADQSVGKVNQVLSDLEDWGVEGVKGWKIEENEPKDLLEALDAMIRDADINAPTSISRNILMKVMKKFKAMSKKDDTCPCCRRPFSGAEEKKQFTNTLKALTDENESPLLNVEDDALKEWQSNRNQIQHWRDTVYSAYSDLKEYRRILTEISEKQKAVDSEKGELDTIDTQVRNLEKEVSEANDAESKLRDLNELCKRWREQANRVEEQSTNIEDNEERLHTDTSAGNATLAGFQSLDEVEDAINKAQEEQNALYDQLNKKNKKLSDFNKDLAAAQQLLSNRSNLCAKREESFAEEQKATERKEELEKRKATLSDEISKLGEQIASLSQKIKAKENEKTRLYNHSSDEEAKVNETLNLFLSDFKHLKDVHKSIEDFDRKEEQEGNSLEQIAADTLKVTASIKEITTKSNEIKVQLESASKVVGDQERQKKLLRDNIDLLESGAQLQGIEEDIEALKKEEASVKGADLCQDLHDKAETQILESQEKISSYKGRESVISEQIRNLRRKLNAPEYRNVDQEFKEAKIRMETTEMAAKDLDKYSQALDQALLRFHSVKIGHINSIIKELWMKCYKGGDIDNIEIESDSASKAAKSYNYRVVMTKGGTKMDMRGRCSAGQRVLASIVIRLALGETFGVNCGCLVLDEPTVNLDEENKKGLASAMAQIIQARSIQTNFQLVLITHDEDFVTMMKDQLQTGTGISMPEKFFHVRREEASDGKYYSKIDAVDWDELL